ncbi:MAG: DUF192 domain-containing protein [Thermococci archaeon]|nr:DUF192 domain-containing protein [Thermococci archaeon]
MIRNETKGVIWQGSVRIADTFFRRFKGLMFERGINHALVFVLPIETRINASIHMFFMFEDIDVMWLDSTRRVVDFKRARKMRIYYPESPAKYIIEGPVGIIKTLKVEKGDLITWTEEQEGRRAAPVGIPSNGAMTFRDSGRPVMMNGSGSLKAGGGEDEGPYPRD